MRPQSAKLLLDAFQAASHVRSFLTGRMLDDYLSDVSTNGLVFGIESPTPTTDWITRSSGTRLSRICRDCSTTSPRF